MFINSTLVDPCKVLISQHSVSSLLSPSNELLITKYLRILYSFPTACPRDFLTQTPQQNVSKLLVPLPSPPLVFSVVYSRSEVTSLTHSAHVIASPQPVDAAGNQAGQWRQPGRLYRGPRTLPDGWSPGARWVCVCVCVRTCVCVHVRVDVLSVFLSLSICTKTINQHLHLFYPRSTHSFKSFLPIYQLSRVSRNS